MSTVFDSDFAPRDGKKTGDFPPVFVSFYPMESGLRKKTALCTYLNLLLTPYRGKGR